MVHIVTRSQKRVGDSFGHFGGPDHYVAVVVVPDGVAFDPARTPLNRSVLAKKGVKITVCGEYYERHKGPRSRYAEAMREAERIVASLAAQPEGR